MAVMRIYPYFFLTFLIILFSCKDRKKSAQLKRALRQEVGFKNQGTGYDYADPKVLSLNNSLQEISGLSFYGGYLYTHNDEEGKIFKIDSNSGKIVEETPFGKNGDYEGIEVSEEGAVIVKSNGNLSFFDFHSKKLTIKKSPLKTNNNVEGLCFIGQKRLLIACKGETLSMDAKNKEKAVYSYNLENDTLNKMPFLSISDKKIEKYLKRKITSPELSKNLKDRALEFSPSGIAIHPITKEIYILSAKGSTLFIFSVHKELQEVIFLNKKQLPQPEGICFDNIAKLYISTETKDSVGRIYKYSVN